MNNLKILSSQIRNEMNYTKTYFNRLSETTKGMSMTNGRVSGV